MSKFLLKIKTKTGQEVVDTLNPSCTYKDLIELLSNLLKLPTPNIGIRFGYPPKPLECVDDTRTLEDLNIKSGETLIVEEKLVDDDQAKINTVVDEEGMKTKEVDAEEMKASVSKLADDPLEFGLDCGLLMRQVVPADNSCLFTSLGFVLGGKVDTTCGSYMRQIIAEEIRANEDEYCEGILGKPRKEYITWILKPESWGGAIELAALSKHYGLEIAVVDTQSGVINRFGEDKNYDYRVFLIFDGIHYDPLFREPLNGGPKQTMFLREDGKALGDAEELAREAKNSRQYTDVQRFTLRCLVCRLQLTGQAQAQQHAKLTGHLNFGEILS